MTTKKSYKETDVKKYLTYQNMFWLFMIANVTGVILEGTWTFFKFGRWETHVNTIWGPFCLIYGAGAVTFYIGSVVMQHKHIITQFLVFAAIGDTVEYICAWLLEEGLGMKAWTYNKHFMNIQGRISLQMTIIWGAVGIIYAYLLVPRMGSLFRKLQGKRLAIACTILTIFMIINISMTVLCVIRWSDRHYGKAPANRMDRVLDQRYDDEFMKKRFCEWWFIDEGKEFWRNYKKKY